MNYYLALSFWLVFGAVLIFLLSLSRRKKERHWANVRAVTTSWEQFREKEQRSGLFKGLVAEAEMAGLDVTSVQLTAILLAGIIGGFVLGYAVTGSGLFSCAGGLLGLFLPGVWVRKKIEGRARAFEEQLEKGLTAMAASLHAGSNTVQAVEEAARKAQEPLKSVMEEIQTLMSTGETLPKALEIAGRKVKSHDMATVSMAITVNMRTGAKLVNVLDQVVDSVRIRRVNRAQFAAKGAQAKAAGNILLAVPLMFLLIFRIMNPEYMKPLLQTATGNIVLGFALGMFLVGWLIIRKILAVEVE